MTSRLQSFETEVLTQEENLAGLAALNRELVAKAEAIASPRRVVLDMDSTEVRVHGRQEQSAYNGHFESTCYHPLLLFNREGDCLGLAALLWMAIILCAVIGVMRREPPFGAALNHWDETVAYAALFALVSSFNHSVPV